MIKTQQSLISKFRGLCSCLSSLIFLTFSWTACKLKSTKIYIYIYTIYIDRTDSNRAYIFLPSHQCLGAPAFWKHKGGSPSSCGYGGVCVWIGGRFKTSSFLEVVYFFLIRSRNCWNVNFPIRMPFFKDTWSSRYINIYIVDRHVKPNTLWTFYSCLFPALPFRNLCTSRSMAGSSSSSSWTKGYNDAKGSWFTHESLSGFAWIFAQTPANTWTFLKKSLLDKSSHLWLSCQVASTWL